MAELQDYGTAASNNSAPSPNGWPEGMAPSGLNDSDRELAARIARERDDTQGVTATGGSANAYTFAAARDTAAAYTGETFTFRANHTNTGAATFNVTPSGGAARGTVAIQTGGRALAGGEIRSGGVYTVTYDGTQYQLENPSTGWQLIQSQTASASSALDFTTGIDSTYDQYAFVFSNVLPATDGVAMELLVSEDGGSTFKTGATDYEHNTVSLQSDAAGVSSGNNSQGDNSIIFTRGNVGSAAGEGVSGVIYMLAPAATAHHHFYGNLMHMTSDATPLMMRDLFGGVYNGTTNPINAVRFNFQSGNIASGTIALYGLRK